MLTCFTLQLYPQPTIPLQLSISTAIGIAHTCASLLRDTGEAVFALAFGHGGEGGILLVKLPVTGTAVTTSLKRESTVPRFLSGITGALRWMSHSAHYKYLHHHIDPMLSKAFHLAQSSSYYFFPVEYTYFHYSSLSDCYQLMYVCKCILIYTYFGIIGYHSHFWSVSIRFCSANEQQEKNSFFFNRHAP